MPRSKKKGPRDPNAPKQSRNAYLLFQDNLRIAHRDMKFADFSKFASAMYADLPQHDKEVWNARAEEDKQRYTQELMNYVPPMGYDPHGYPLFETPAGLTPLIKKPRRDANAPKRNLSAYLLYQNAMRDQFTRDNPDMNDTAGRFGRLAKYTSHMWKALSTEERATWEARAQQDKARYERELASYQPPPGHDRHGVLIDEEALAHRLGTRKKTKPIRDPNAPKRVRSPYVLFTNVERPKILEEAPDISFIDLGKELGKRWRELDAFDRRSYEGLARQDKVRFKREMAEYEEHHKAFETTAAAPPPGRPHEDEEDAAFYDAAATLEGLDHGMYSSEAMTIHMDDPYAAPFDG